jgi:hypothetical protein
MGWERPVLVRAVAVSRAPSYQRAIVAVAPWVVGIAMLILSFRVIEPWRHLVVPAGFLMKYGINLLWGELPAKKRARARRWVIILAAWVTLLTLLTLTN